jgi:hypothetical protein
MVNPIVIISLTKKINYSGEILLLKDSSISYFLVCERRYHLLNSVGGVPPDGVEEFDSPGVKRTKSPPPP